MASAIMPSVAFHPVPVGSCHLYAANRSRARWRSSSVNKVAYRCWSACASTVRSSRWWAHKVVNPVRRRVAPEQLPRRGESALFAEHLQEACGVVAELALAPKELSRILDDLEAVEPLLRRVADHENDPAE